MGPTLALYWPDTGKHIPLCCNVQPGRAGSWVVTFPGIGGLLISHLGRIARAFRVRPVVVNEVADA